MGDPGFGSVPALFPAGHQAGAFRRGHQRLVCRSGSEEWVLPLRPDELSRSASLLRAAALRVFIWQERLGTAPACRAPEH